MKIPKKVWICGREFDVVLDKKQSGGSFSFSDCKIVVGTKYPKDIAITFLHEVIEAVFAERCMRYKLYNDSHNQDYQFAFKHTEYENAVVDIYTSLKDCLK